MENTNKIIGQVMRHLSLLDMVLASSNKILAFALEKNATMVEQESNNRDRLINVLQQLQSQIEDMVNGLNDTEIRSDFVAIMKSWAHDLNLWIMKSNQIDRKILENLQEQKEETTQEIATIYANREQFKGYNLSSVKK